MRRDEKEMGSYVRLWKGIKSDWEKLGRQERGRDSSNDRGMRV